MQTSDDLIRQLKTSLKIEDEFRADGIELKRAGADYVCCCPFHEEKTASCRVHPADQYFKCFGCGAKGDVLEYLTMSMKKEFPEVLDEACRRAHIDRTERPQAKQKTIYLTTEKLREAAGYFAKDFKITEWNEYTHPNTKEIELITIRMQNGTEKKFFQASPAPGGWVFGGLVKNPLFNRTRIREHNAVVVVEGEKCVRVLHDLGICATTSPGGSNAAGKADWAPLAGKHVTIWRDNDAGGLKYQQEVIALLQGLTPPPEISIVDVPALKLEDGGDVADFIQQPECGEMAVCEVIANADETGTFQDMKRDIDDAISGVRFNVPFPWPALSKSMRALIPGAVSILCGPPGDGKSLALLQVMAHCCELKIPSLLLCCEDGAAYHLRRRLAQIAGESHLTDDEWCKDNPEKVKALMALHKPYLDEFAKCLDAPGPDNGLTCDDLINWVKRAAQRAYRVLAIDPVTAMAKGKFGFEDDRKFMMECKKIIEEYKCSLLLVTHPPKVTGNSKFQGMSEMAGGAAYERFSQSIWCFSAHDLKTKQRDGSSDPERGKPVEFNRTVRVLKARNSWGKGKYFAFDFNLPTLSVSEFGQVEK